MQQSCCLGEVENRKEELPKRKMDKKQQIWSFELSMSGDSLRRSIILCVFFSDLQNYFSIYLYLCSCCVDEVAAEHLDADSIIHYGRACLSPTRRLPVMYVFGQKSIDLHQCADSFRVLYPDKFTPVIILCDVIYSHALGKSLVIFTLPLAYSSSPN